MCIDVKIILFLFSLLLTRVDIINARGAGGTDETGTNKDTHQMPVISMGMLIDVPSFYAIYCHGKGLSREPHRVEILFR